MNKQITINQIKAIVVFEFLNSYNEFERALRSLFEKTLEKLSSDQNNIKEELHFIRGGLIASYIDSTDPFGLKLSKISKLVSTQFLKLLLTLSQLLIEKWMLSPMV